jgi:hypothetical protein
MDKTIGRTSEKDGLTIVRIISGDRCGDLPSGHLFDVTEKIREIIPIFVDNYFFDGKDISFYTKDQEKFEIMITPYLQPNTILQFYNHCQPK